MSNKHRHNPVQNSGAAGNHPVRPVSVPANPPSAPLPAAEELPIALVASDESREAPKPPDDPKPPQVPAWRNRIQSVNDELATAYKVIPGTWLAKRTRKTIMTARELHRLGYDPKRYVKLGLVEKA